MGMQEFRDGQMSEPTRDLEKLMRESSDENVKATHFGLIDKLKGLKEKVDAGEVTNEDFRRNQLNRIEGMLSAMILHLSIPYKGIITMPNPSTTQQPEGER